jgi:hypothetical protein
MRLIRFATFPAALALAILAACGRGRAGKEADSPLTSTRNTAADDSLLAARRAVQRFYNGLASSNGDLSLPWLASSDTATAQIGRDLAVALDADRAAAADRSEPREVLGGDPFLTTQDTPLCPFVADSAARAGGNVRVVVYYKCPGSERPSPTTLRVSPANGRWEIVDVLYGDTLSLRRLLCGFAMHDTRPEKRAKSCP